MLNPKRKYHRIPASQAFPVQLKFSEPELSGVEAKITIKDISSGGLGLKIPLGLQPLEEGMPIRDMEVILPGGVKFVLSGRVLYKRFGQCGIGFSESESRKLKALDSYLRMKLKDLQGRS